MTDDAFDLVLVPVLRDLRDYLGDIVLIGGWVPELHRRFGGTECGTTSLKRKETREPRVSSPTSWV